jgi:hypothetical protein
MLVAQGSRDLEPVHTGHSQIQDNRLCGKADGQNERPTPVVGDLNVMARLRKQGRQGVGAVYVVIYHENTHCRPKRVNFVGPCCLKG